MLERVSIAAPCSADWDSMTGTDQIRHCGKCDKNVYNLSAMTRRQAEALLRGTEGRICARLYRRADGTILTENCPVGLRAIGRRISRVAGAAMSAVATLSSARAAQFPMFPVPSALLGARSSVTGIVKDIRGEGLSDAEVVVTRTGTELSLVRSTDSTGHFRVETLTLGTYTIKIQVPGFRLFTKQVILRPLQEYKIDATLQIGTTGAAVVVDYAK
jgi:Carboxypeptidase regulatory-like domain